MRKLGSVALFCIGIVLVIGGCIKLYTALTGGNNESDAVGASVKINEVVSNKDGVEFCVTNVENVKSIDDGYSEMTTDNNFIVVTIKIVNNSNEPYNVNAGRFILICDGAEYEYEADAVLKVDNAMWMDEINPGITKEYKVVYETPTTSVESEYKLKIKPVGFSEKDSVYITLK